MTLGDKETLRLMFVIRPHETEVVGGLATRWRSVFEAWPSNQRPNICVWVTGQHLNDVSLPGMCVHTLELGEAVDFYARSPRERTPWSPWGLKSGPNFQFFEVLRRMHTAHDTEWVLQLEADTVPLRAVDQSDIGWILDSDELWVAGASARFAEAKSLSAATADHLNGAAFYRVGSPEFIEFLAHTWARSLLHISQVRPALAYDSLTSPGVWRELPEHLFFSWRENAERFGRVPGMVNLSNRTLSTSDPTGQLREAGDVFSHQPSPWFLHLAKSDYRH